jgi:Ser/Thr protein kinase RdoA (MazF antagonist)
MDDAGCGRRGPRPTLSDGLIASVEHHYGISIDPPIDLGGSANLNLLVAAAGDQRLIVRAHRAHVTAGRLTAIQQAREHLAAGGVPCAQPTPTRDGASFIEVGPNLVEVEPYVEGDAMMNSLTRVAAGLPILGRIHELLSAIEPQSASSGAAFANYVDPIGVVAATRAGTDRIRAWAPTEEEALLADATDRLAEAVARANRQFVDLPRQLVHGDYWDNNVLFHGRQIVLVADLDFMGNRHRIDDLALTLHFSSYLFDDPLAEGSLRHLARFLDAYDSGTSLPLSTKERAAIPVAIARQPLWSIAVWAAALDDQRTARRHLTGHLATVKQGLRIVNQIDRLQEALAT